MPSRNQSPPPDTAEAVARLAAIVESSDDAIIGKNLDGIITSWNQAAERIYGYTSGEVIGKSITLIIPPNRLNEETIILENIKNGRRIDHFETVRRAKDGREIEVSVTISPIRGADGKIVGASKISRDITERKQLEQARKKYAHDLEKKVEERTAKLQSAVSDLEAFSYTVSHDLRAPLRAMQQFAETLLEDYGDKLDDNGKSYIRRIISSSVKLDSLVRDVLTYSRVIRAHVEFHPVQIESFVREIIAQDPALQPPRGQVQIVSPLLPVLANEIFLCQVLSNLLTNAAKFVAPGVQPQIKLCTEIRGNKVRLCIQDNGIGIVPEHHARIFSMFERLNAAAEYEGTGIGLTIVRKAAERMGGVVGLESELGKGSTFWIELPPATQAVQARGAL